MYEFDSRVRYSEVDSEGKMTLSSIMNYFQDCTTFQSEDLGIGIGFTAGKGVAWMVSSWQIVIDHYPRLAEKITTGTLPYELKGFLGLRNFSMKSEDGRFAAKANSVWSMIDTKTGRPTAILPEIRDKYELEEKLSMEYLPRKIAVPEGGEVGDPITVLKHHLDTNHHVNNQQFVNMAIDYIPENAVVRQIRVEYKKQAFLGDVMIPYIVQEENKYFVLLKDAEGKPYVITEFEFVE